jgi:acyl carrier protein
MNIQSEIERFIVDDLLAGSRPSLDPDEALFNTGTLDSLGTLRLISFLEERYGIAVQDGDVGDDNFGNLSKLAAFVERKKSGGA